MKLPGRSGIAFRGSRVPLAAVLVAIATRSPMTSDARPASPQAADTGTVAYDIAGVHVIQRFARTSDIVVANLYLLGGVRNVSNDNAGIETLLLEASERGTESFSRNRLRQLMARLGTSIVTSARTDWSSIGMRATRTTFDSTWDVLASRVIEPLLDSSDVELVRDQLLAAVRQRRDSPDALVDFLADSFAFAGHPYARPPTGTERSLSRVTVDDLRRYHAGSFVKSRMLLVVVGNIARSNVERAIARTLGHLPPGSYRWTLPDTLPHSEAAVLAVYRPLPTNYILGEFAGPPADSRDYQALRIATAVLSGQLFSEIRSRRNLTYAVEAPFVERAVAAGGLYVTTVSPDVTLGVMRQELDALKGGFVDPSALERLVQQFVTQYFIDNESAADQADFLVRAQLYQGDYHAADRFGNDLRAITGEDIRRVARRYMRDVKFVFIGDTSRVPTRIMERF